MISFEITCHRWILAEINTHRALSRNYRSSRAVPVTKLIEEVRYNPAMPVAWLKNKPGMVATEPMTADEASLARSIWKSAAFDAAYRAGTLSDLGLHKQWVNRILEPYLYVHGVISGTDWANFYSLRRAPDAQPEFKALADAMWEAQEESEPGYLTRGAWHLPYVSDEECMELWKKPHTSGTDHPGIPVSVARVARVSIKPFDADTIDVAKDLELYEKLLVQKHMSPFEHQATPDVCHGYGTSEEEWLYPEHHGNLRGWVQYRKTILGEHVPG
jgi:thymidylate synthase ThyX